MKENTYLQSKCFLIKKTFLWGLALLISYLVYLPIAYSWELPKAKFEPEELSLVVPPGQTLNKEIEFYVPRWLKRSQRFGRFVLAVSGEGEDLLEVSPETLPKLKNNKSLNINLRSTVPEGMAFSSKDLEVKMYRRIKFRGKTKYYPVKYSVPLKVTLNIEPAGLPTDPGEEGKLTIAGIDSDNDGLRDDVQRWIALNSSNSTVTTAVLSQFGKAEQAGITAVEINDDIVAEESTKKAWDAVICESYLKQNAELLLSTDDLLMVFLNTRERIQMYNKYLSIHASVVDFPQDENGERSRCDFELTGS